MPKSKSRKKKTPKRVLALPDLEHAKTNFAWRFNRTSCSNTEFTSHNADMRRRHPSGERSAKNRRAPRELADA